MTSKLAIVVRLFLFIFVVCFVLMGLFASLPVVLCTAGILTLMQGFHWLFVNVGMAVIYKDDDGYRQAKRLGYWCRSVVGTDCSCRLFLIFGGSKLLPRQKKCDGIWIGVVIVHALFTCSMVTTR